MKAGRELDALIAEKVMGYKATGYEFAGRDMFDKGNGMINKFRPSENIADAWIVVEEYKRTGAYWCEIAFNNKAGHWYARFVNRQIELYERAETAPLAICLAALKACRVEVEG